MAMPTRSLRLTFRYSEKGLELVDQTPRRSPPPPTERLDRDVPSSAVSLEVRSADEKVSYRSLVVDGISQSIEVGGKRGGEMARHAYATPSGAFSVVIPAPEKGSVVVLSAGPGASLRQLGVEATERSVAAGEEREIGRFRPEGS